MVKWTTTVDLAGDIDGWMAAQEMAWLHTQASMVAPGGRWVEIGSWKGRSFFATAMGLPADCKITAVDHWQGTKEEKAAHKMPFTPTQIFLKFASTVAKIRELRNDIKIEVCMGNSCDFSLEADVVFLDGGHDHDNVVKDLEHWRKHLKPGGLLCGHDYQFFGVASALEQCNIKVEVVTGSIWKAV